MFDYLEKEIGVRIIRGPITTEIKGKTIMIGHGDGLGPGDLKYKFIMCVEGVDVATNLKWVMSSNSIAVMPRPKIESWFMENKLIPEKHYIEIKEDYSDLESKIKYYIKNPEKCKSIIKNANDYVIQFKNKNREDLISLLVLEKYFHFTGQQEKTSFLDY